MSELSNDDQVLRAVGASLSNWSLVELQLATLFTVLSDIPDQDKSQAIFDTIISFDTRLALCDRLMTFENADETEAEMWRKISTKLSKTYKKRHELAHFTIIPEHNGKPAISPFLTGDKFRTGTIRYLTLEQIKERSAKFIELHMAIFWFKNQAIYRRYPKLTEDQEQVRPEPPLVPQLRALAIQTLAEKKHPAQSQG